MNYSLTNPQNSIWLTEKFYANTSINNICGYVYISDVVNFTILKKAINELVKANDAMRLKFKEENNSCIQYVSEYQPFDIQTIQLSSKEDMEKRTCEVASIPFEIINHFLFKFELVELPDGSGGFIINVHHIIGDAWSLGLIVQEIMNIYANLLKGYFEDKDFPSYLNYIAYEANYINSDKFNKDKAFWDEVFQTIPEVATIPSAAKNSAGNISCRGARKEFIIPKEKINFIRDFCNKYQISIYNFFMAVYSLYIGRVSNLDDFVIGTPVLNRTNFEQKHTLGMFISTVPLRIQLNYETSFADFTKKIATDTLSIFRHQRYPYQAILEDLRKRDSSIPNLYSTVLSYQATKTVEEGNTIPYSSTWIFNGNAADDLQIHLFDLNDASSLTIAYDYKADKYDEKDLTDLHARILTIISQIIDNNNVLLKELEIVTPEEKNKIIYDFNNTKLDYPQDKTIVDLFEEQVAKTPDNIAVVYENQELTYRELNEKSNQLARFLLTNNISIGDTVGILLDKSLEVIIAMFGILKVGAAFLPLDIDYPDERLEYILNNSKLKLILSSKHICKKLNANIVHIDLDNHSIYNLNSTNNLNIAISPEDVMYVMYTSGSTGNPKGVMVKHKNIVRLAMYPNFIHFSDQEVMVQTGTFVFDACIFEIFGSLLHGFKLYIIQKENLLDINYFFNFLREKQVTILFLTTGLFNQLGLQKPEIFKNLKYLLTGGDVISKLSVQKILEIAPNIKMINCYGPTENGSYSTCYEINGKEENIPIGKPITNSLCYVVSSTGNLCPIGIPGELWVGGNGVAKGYLNNEILTKEKFIPNPFGDGMIYKTGDLVKWLPDGNIEFIGRIDNQVKVRGFRIELSEIDNQILTYPNIKQAVSIIQNINNTKTICSYIVAANSINVKKLKDYLSKILANYMLPTYITQLDTLPLNINGKIDRKVLPIPTMTRSSAEIVPARNKVDFNILSSLEKCLSLEKISIDDNLFDIGLDSLSAITLSTNISKQLKVQVTVKNIFEHPTVQDLSDYISTLSESSNQNTIVKAEKRDVYPLSSAQKRIYYSANLDSNSTLYNIAGSLVINSVLDINKLQKCFDILINRHEALRTHFEIKNDEIVQIIDDKIDFELTLDSITTNNLDKIYANFVQPFDLSKAPLFRAKVVKLKDDKMLLLLDMHHIISDGTSLGILLQELCDLYNGITLPENKVDYKDFTLWEKEQFKTEEFKKEKEFWVNKFQDEIPLLNMPTNYPRPSVQSFEGSNYHTILSEETFNKVDKITKSLNITPYMLLLSVYYILLSKYSSQDDIVVGTPIVGRELPELSNMLGMFVNTLALRNKVNQNSTFEEFCRQIKENCLSCFENQAYPFDELVKELNIKRDTSRNPLFDVMFVYQNNGYPEVNFEDVQVEYIVPDNNVSKFDLTLEIIPKDNEYNLRFEYCTKLFDEDFIKRFALHYTNLLNAILENTEVKIADMNMLSEEEKNQILYDFNNTKTDYPKDKTIIDLFEEQVAKTPDNIAVVFEDQKLTYRQLNEKANQLARILLAHHVEVGDMVCILLDKSLEMIVSILAILKVGGTFLPIDINYPKERIDYIIRDSKSNILLTTQNLIGKANATVQVINVELNNIQYNQYSSENVGIHYSPQNLMYVMYTSGSTGNPKGVMVTHQNAVRLVINNAFIHYAKNERILQTGSIVFDACTFEIWGALLNGFELYIIEKELLLDAAYLKDYMKKNKITTLFITTQLFNQLVDSDIEIFSMVSNVLTGGEAVSVKHMNRLNLYYPNIHIIHCYGPTENTTFSTCYDVEKIKYKYTVPIGKPISNSTAYVISSTGHLCPIDVPGELWVGGDGVAKGYLNNETLTNEKFIQNPFDNGMIYKTGDLVKWLPDGNIEFIGRIDNQVKVRGFRIELSEIDSKILEYPDIKYSITVLNTINNEKVICSYFVADSNIDLAKLKEFLKNSLPNYMIPTYMLQLESFQMNINGKIDKKTLPTDFRVLKKTKIIKKPSNETEESLLKIYQTIINTEEISVTDNLFEDLHGDSLIAMKIQVEALSQGVNIAYSDIFKYPTIKQLADHLLNSQNEVKASSNASLEDFKKYDAILQKNSLDYPMEIPNTLVGNVLLTGFTGFLGAHILDSFIKKETGNIYCLIRSKNNMSAQERLINVLHFYFEDKYDQFIGNRIQVVEGDISFDKLGLSNEEYAKLGKNISTVIHSAALVKHYGMYKDFESANIIGTQNIVEFARQFHLRLLHISTLSVSGNNFADGAHVENDFETDVDFAENNFYIGQNVESLYAKSKFEAEHIVLDAIYTYGLQACILRMGNLTSRFSEGKFQQNHFENAFVNRFKSFLQIGYVPDYMLELYAEFTPIDYCGDAIIEIAKHFNPNYTVFHLMNEKRVYLDRLFEMMDALNIDIKLVSEEKFINIINDLLADENKKMYIEGIINDFDKNNKHLIYESKVKVKCDFSKTFLEKIGFEWPYIDINYMRNYFKYLGNIGYLNVNIK